MAVAGEEGAEARTTEEAEVAWGRAHEVKELLVRAWGLVSVLAFVGGDHQARILAGALHALSNWTIGSGASVVVPACMEDTIIITSI